jgi:hypothetical protein
VRNHHPQTTRNHLLWVADHLVEIEAWRETLPANQRDQWNHPTTVKRAYERAMVIRVAKEKGEERLSPMAEMKQAVIEAQTQAADWKRRAEKGGSLFDLKRDTPEQIARIIVDSCTSSRVEKLVQALRAELKRQKQAHAS